MKELLTQIENLQIELQRVNARLQDLRSKMSFIEAEETIKIVRLKDEATGKPIYSNDKLREAALVRNLATDASYQTYEAELRELENRKVITAALLEQRRGEFKMALLLKAEAIESLKARDSY